MPDEDYVVFRDDYALVTRHVPDDGTVCLQTGRPPEDDPPTVVDAEALRDGLDEYLATVNGGDAGDG